MTARVFLLKYWEAGDGAEQPYRIDTLAGAGVELASSDAAARRPWTFRPVHRTVRRLERLGAPFLQTVLATARIARSDATIAIFESQGNFLAWVRSLHLWPYTRPRFAVVSCWLANDAPDFGPRRLRWYRRAYRGVDLVVHFSRNQTAGLRDVLGIPEERLAFVPFGIDHEYFSPDQVEPDGDGAGDGGYVVAVGRDKGRDWATLFDAVRGTDLDVRLACRPEDIAGLDVPGNVTVLGVVDRDTYRSLTARARVVVVPTHVRAYPTGQSVTLESMAMGKCCVVTGTPAMSDYLHDGVDAVLVPPHDGDRLRVALQRAVADAELRARLGAAARAAVEERFNARTMWATVARLLVPDESRLDQAG
jgi:glycosyltransferase involved in cell wall biosynthesis